MNMTSSMVETLMQPGKILVTGGAGFVGSHVANALLRRGDLVVVVDQIENTPDDVDSKRSNMQQLQETWNDQVQLYEGDLCDEVFLKKVFSNEPNIRKIIHFGGRASFHKKVEDPSVFITGNLTTTTRLLEMARLHGRIEHFVYASSSSVYGESFSVEMSESDLVERPITPHGASKKMCELMAHTYHHLYGLNVTGLRLFTVYGPQCRPDMPPFKLISRIFNGRQIAKLKTCLGDYTYIDDIVDGVLLALDKENAGYDIYNLGQGKPLILEDWVEAIESASGSIVADKHELDQDNGDAVHWASIEKAKQELGYSPKVSLSDGVARTVEWYKVFKGYAQGEDLDENYAPRQRSLSHASSDGEEEMSRNTRKLDKGMLPPVLSKEAQRLVLSLHLSTTSFEQELALTGATGGGGGSEGEESSVLNSYANAKSWAPGDNREEERRAALRNATPLADLFSPQQEQHENK